MDWRLGLQPINLGEHKHFIHSMNPDIRPVSTTKVMPRKPFPPYLQGLVTVDGVSQTSDCSVCDSALKELYILD